MNIAKVVVNIFQFDRTNWRAVTLCFLAAAVFWVFNALNKEYSTNVQFPLVFDYDQSRYAPAAKLPADINLNVTGNGWDLLRRQLGVNLPALTLPVERPTDGGKIAGSALMPTLGPQLSNLKLNFVATDSLQVIIDERARRKIKVVANLEGVTFEKDFTRISPVIVLPDSVVVEGPKRLLAAMDDSIVVELKEKKIDENYRAKLTVPLDNEELIIRYPENVEVMFEVGNVIQIEKWVKLEVVNLPRSAEVESDSIFAIFRIPARDEEMYRTQTWWAEVDLQQVQKGETRKLVPRLTALPKWVQLVAIDSVAVRRY